MQWNLLYNVPFEGYMVNFKGGSFFLCSVYLKKCSGDLQWVSWEWVTFVYIIPLSFLKLYSANILFQYNYDTYTILKFTLFIFITNYILF